MRSYDFMLTYHISFHTSLNKHRVTLAVQSLMQSPRSKLELCPGDMGVLIQATLEVMFYLNKLPNISYTKSYHTNFFSFSILSC